MLNVLARIVSGVTIFVLMIAVSVAMSLAMKPEEQPQGWDVQLELDAPSEKSKRECLVYHVCSGFYIVAKSKGEHVPWQLTHRFEKMAGHYYFHVIWDNEGIRTRTPDEKMTIDGHCMIVFDLYGIKTVDHR